MAGLASACRSAGVPLVLAGGTPWGGAVPPGALSLGYVPRDVLPALYGAATVVAYCSKYEGFGLPPLEAMACGAAVVASRVASLPEVLGDAACLVEPGDGDVLAGTLRRLFADDEERVALGLAASKRATGFSWLATAAGTARSTARSCPVSRLASWPEYWTRHPCRARLRPWNTSLDP
ncbi:MAG: glycosyltransferase [Acidimicrobiales bacterium]